MDIREAVAKMRAQAEQNRQAEAKLRATAQGVMDDAQAEYERIAEEAKTKYNAIAAQADAQADEAAYWEGLAEREAKQSAMPPATDQPHAGAAQTLTDGQVPTP